MSDAAKDLTKTNNVKQDGSTTPTVQTAPKKKIVPKKIVPEKIIQPPKTGGASISQNDFSVLSFIGVTKTPDIVLTPMQKGEQDLAGDDSKNGTSHDKKPKPPVGDPTNITSETTPTKPIKQPINQSLKLDDIAKEIEPKKFNYDANQIEKIELSDNSPTGDFFGEDSGFFDNIFSGGSKGSSDKTVGGNGSGGDGGGGRGNGSGGEAFFDSFGRAFKKQKDKPDNTPNKRPQKPSNDPNLENPKPIKTPKSIDVAEEAPILSKNVEKYILDNSARSLFRKSYSVFNQLTPFIKCFIKIKNKNDSENINVNLLDIPYNFIKSLEVTYETGGSVNGVINLKLEDAGGAVGIPLMSQLWSLGLTSGDMNGVPKIIIQFGWALNGIQKIKKNTKIYTSNFFDEYLIEDVEMDYGQNFSQEITIKARQEKTSIDGFLRDPNSPDTPYKILTKFPLKILRAKQYAFYLNENDVNDASLKKFGITNESEKTQAKITITKFLQEGYNVVSSSNFNLLDENPIFNCFKINNIDTTNNDFIEKFNGPINRSKFTPYFALYYFLNQYIKVIKNAKNALEEIKKTEGSGLEKIEIKVLNFYDTNKIDKYGKEGSVEISDVNNSTNKKDYFTLVENDINAGTSKIGDKKNTLLSVDFQITESETWEALLERVANQVHYKTDATTRLSVSINYFPLEVAKRAEQFKDNNIFSGSAELNKLKNFDNLTKRLDQLVEAYKKLSKDETEKKVSKRVTKKISEDSKDFNFKKNIEEIKEKLQEEYTKGDLILIIISAGSKFLVEENIKDALVIQKYTVFPKIKPTFELKHQNFNSGSRRMIDESFPDVIDFKPKIDFKRILTSHFAKFNIVNFKNGIVEIKSESEIKISEDIPADQINKKLEEVVKAFEDFLNQATPTTPTTPTTPSKTLTFKEITVLQTKYYHLENNKSVIFTLNLFNKRVFNSNSVDDKVAIKPIYEKMIKILGDVRSNTIYSLQNNLFRKAIKVTPGYNQIADFQGYEILANEYLNNLKASAYDFEAELTILGEPGFTFDYGLSMNHIYLEVNNSNGQKNPFLTGRYYVSKMKHTIQGSKFLTILSLKYDSPTKSDVSSTNL